MSGYRVFWTDHALDELKQTVAYLRSHFTDREVERLAKAVESTLRNISQSPTMYQESPTAKGVRRVIVLRFNSLYYRINAERRQVEILSFFANRKNPDSLEL